MSESAATVYDAWYRTPLGAAAHAVELTLVAELARPESGERALDVGCGTGVYTAWLAERGLQVTGVDRDAGMLAAAEAKAAGARLLEADAAALPFAAGEFDLALAVTVFSFLDGGQRARAAAELLRVVRPGGRVVIADLARYSLWAARRRLEGWRGSATWRRTRFLTAGELRRLLTAAGASAATTRYGLYLPPWPLPALLRRAQAVERLGRRAGPAGAAFVAARGER